MQIKTNNLMLAYIAYVLAWDVAAVFLLPLVPSSNGIWQPIIAAAANLLVLVAVLNLLSRFPVKLLEAIILLLVSSAATLAVYLLWRATYSAHVISTLPIATIALQQLVRIGAPKNWNLRGRDCDANWNGRGGNSATNCERPRS